MCILHFSFPSCRRVISSPIVFGSAAPPGGCTTKRVSRAVPADSAEEVANSPSSSAWVPVWRLMGRMMREGGGSFPYLGPDQVAELIK